MAETLLAAFATEAGTAAAATAAGSAIGPVTAAASGAGTLSIIGNVGGSLLTGVSVLGSIQSGRQQAVISKAQAAQYELTAKQEELRGRQQADSIRRALQANLATQRAVFSARGVNPNTGTPLVFSQQSQTAAGRDIDTAMYSAGMDAAQNRLAASQQRIESKTSASGGYMDAAAKLYGGRDMFGSLLR